MTRSIALLGSTGSIGRQTLEVARELGLTVAALTANSSVDLIEQQAREFCPRLAVLYDEAAAVVLRERLRDTKTQVLPGMEGLLAALEDDIMDDLENLQSCMQRLSLKDVLRYRVNKKPMPFLVNLFDYLREQGDFLHAIMGPKGDPSFGPRVRDAVCTEIIQTILHERYRNDPSPFVQYYVAFYASAYLGVITHWIETGMKESSQEMALVAMRLFFIKPGDPIRL